MENIVEIKGNVKYSITLDPGTWILDDRKRKLEEFFTGNIEDDHHLEEYTKAISKQWDKEMLEGNTTPKPQSMTRSKKYIKEELKSETYAISFKYFIKNSEPNESAKEIIVQSSNGEMSFPIMQAEKFALCFSNKGKALTEDGPIHVYYGKTLDEKITDVKAFMVK